jgi:hypothetical protein
MEQALVLAQRVLDLVVARQVGFALDAEPRRRLQLGLAVVAQAALAAGFTMRGSRPSPRPRPS